MAHLRGTGLGRGMALGTAAIVRMRNGFPLMPQIPARIAEKLSKRHLVETPDVILAAEDYRMALDIAGSLRWARVVGIIAGHAESGAPISNYPAVVNVPALLDLIQDDMLIVVDADRGVVIADPNGIAVAEYQAEHDRLAPKRRLYLDEGHLPAETVDDRVVLVLAEVSSADEVATALEAGADLVYVPFDAPLLPDREDDAAKRKDLVALIDRTAGKDLILADEYALPPMLLLEASLRAEITLAEPPMPHLDGLGLGELAEELNSAQAECLANDARCALPRLGLLLRSHDVPDGDNETLTRFVDRLATRGATRIVYSDLPAFDPDRLPFLDALVAACTAAGMPVFLNIADTIFAEADFDGSFTLKTALPLLVGAGAAGLIVKPESVSGIKKAVGELNFSECREALSERLTRSEA